MSTTNFFPQLSKAYEAGHYTDLKITCGSSEFMVHKIIVCSQSTFFHATCSSGFLESSTNTIDLTSDGLDVVSRMIDCLYRGTYADFDATADAQNWKSAHQLHAAMYALGDKYDFAVLKDTALANFNKHVEEASLEATLLGFLESIPIVYSSTPDSDRKLRDITVKKIRDDPCRFLNQDIATSFQKVVFEVPEFSWDLHQYWMNNMPDLSAPPPAPAPTTKRRRY